jgi:ABC-type transport system involved in cytochrome c biogenesis permease subunit
MVHGCRARHRDVVGKTDVGRVLGVGSEFSVEWWNSLHQTATVMQLGKPTMDFDMLWPLLLMLLGFALYFVTVLLIRLRAELLRRERNASWVREELS